MAEKIKISELPEATTLNDFWGIGVDNKGRSVKVPIGRLRGNVGKSAYDIAVEQGYTETENDWLASLGGADGATGKSAYKSAIEGGFFGSEQLFNDTLANIARGGTTGAITVSDTEHRVGIFEDTDGTQHDLYESSFILAELPTVPGTAKEYELSPEPLGYGRYIRVLGLDSVSTDGNTFFYDCYAVDRIFVSDFRTRCIIRCIEADSECSQIVLRLRYIKYFGDKLVFSVDLPEGIACEGVSLSVAPLKYNKHFAFSYISDDSAVGAYARIWRRINRKWMDDIEFFHLGVSPTTGYTPANTLAMTDGCGNERRFPVGISIWPTWGNEYSPGGFIKDESTSTTNPYITWKELELILDFGGSIYYHNVDERKWNKNIPAAIVSGFKEDNDNVFEKLHRRMKVLGVPDGNASYVQAARLSNLVAFWRNSGSSNLITLKDTGILRKQETYGGENTSEIPAKLAELAAQHDSDNPYWVMLTTHRTSLEVVEMLETIYETYGKGGDDSIWVASLDEVYEYVAMREGMVWKKSVNGQTITFEIYVPKGKDFYFRDSSFLLSGIASTDGVTVKALSGSIKGISHTVSDSQMLVNVNFNEALVNLAEKYTLRYEASADETDKEDALYFVNQLLPSLAEPFSTRIAAVTPGQSGSLRIKSITINGGTTITSDRTVSVALSVAGEPAYYRASEKSDLSDADWVVYTSETIRFLLSSGNGAKTLYIQLKNDSTQSSIVFGSIILNQSEQPQQIILNSVTIDSGSSITANRNVTVAIHANTIPTYYRIGETASLADLAWVKYTGTIAYMLSEGNGSKQVYVQIKNASTESAIKSATIILQQSGQAYAMKAVLSLGWDYSAGASGATTYDSTMQLGKVRLTSDPATVYNLYDTEGNAIGTFTQSGLQETGVSNMGNITQNNSGLYPDDALKFSAYKPSSVEEAIIAFNIPAGRYKVKLLVNTKNSALHLDGSYLLEHAGMSYEFAKPTTFVDNFNTTMELTVSTSNHPLLIKLNTSSVENGTMILNLIEIAEL